MTNPPLADRDEILRAIRRIAAPGQVVELRALNVLSGGRSRPVTLSGYFDDFERLAAEAAKIRGAQGVYITLNPPAPAVLARCANRLRVAGAGSATSDSDIVARRWLPVDADPIRPAEISASDAEHEAALETARRIRAALAELGWPAPILADSGNGGHLLYRIDLPVPDLRLDSPNPQIPAKSGGLVERVLAALAARFDDEAVHIDVKVFNPARIWKLYGTVARKGDHTPDRPHRLARILEAPEELAVVPRALLEDLVGCEDAERGRRGEGETSLRVSASPRLRVSFSLASWLAERNVPVGPPHPWLQGGTRWVFPVCPWNPEHRDSAYVVELPSGAIAAGCQHNSCTGQGWQELKRLYDCGLPIADLNTSTPAPVGSGTGPDQSAIINPQSAIRQSAINNPQSEILSWPAIRSRAERVEAEVRAGELAIRCIGLDRAALLQAAAALRRLGLSGLFVGQWLAAVREQRQLARAAAAHQPPPIEYEAEGGRIYRLTWEMAATGEPQARRVVVADFALRIVEEAAAEDGRVWFTLSGEAADGRALRLELPVLEFADDRMLQAAVTAAAGPHCPVRAHMLRHLRPAIQLLSAGEVPRLRRYDRTGWTELRIADCGLRIENSEGRMRRLSSAGQSECSSPQYPMGTLSAIPNPQSENPQLDNPQSSIRNRQFFLIPGREAPGVIIRLPRKLPYRVEAGGDLAQGLIALEAALNAGDPRRTTVLLAALLGAPLARPAGLQGERYGVFLCGRTGSLKTSTAQALMCIYGAGFIEDQYLLKMGEGATRNALMGYASHVHDLPLLLDNFKPSTGDGARGFVNLLHNLLEGGDRERMTRNADLRETRPVHCWPVFTGEDVPDADTAGLARLLILPFEPPLLQQRPATSDQQSAINDQRSEMAAIGNPQNCGAGSQQSAIGTPQSAIFADRLAALTRAQALAAHLPAVGESWLAWLEGEGAAVAGEVGARFPELRARWLDHLREMHAEMTNPLRVASSLTCNELTWWALRRHPQLGAVAERFDETHAAGVYLAAGEAASRTAVSLEAARFLAVLRELIATGRFELVQRGIPQQGGRTPVGNEAPGSSLRRASAPDDRTAAKASSFGDGRPGGGRMTPQGMSAGSPLPERTLGWECPDGSVYLLPELARREVERVLGPGGLNGVSSRTLHEQLSELGMIASRDPGRLTRKIREGGRTHNVLHLLPDALEG